MQFKPSVAKGPRKRWVEWKLGKLGPPKEGFLRLRLKLFIKNLMIFALDIVFLRFIKDKPETGIREFFVKKGFFVRGIWNHNMGTRYCRNCEKTSVLWYSFESPRDKTSCCATLWHLFH